MKDKAAVSLPQSKIDLPVTETELPVLRFLTTEAVPAGAFLRVRAGNHNVLLSYTVEEVRIAGGDAPAFAHRFSGEELKGDWCGVMSRASMAAVAADAAIPAGTAVAVRVKGTAKPGDGSRRFSGTGGSVQLARVAAPQADDWKPVSEPIEIRFLPGPAERLSACRKADGKVWVQHTDAFGNSADPGKLRVTLRAGDAAREAEIEPGFAAALLDPPAGLPEDARIEVRDASGHAALSTPLPVATDGTPIRFGDIHWHSTISDGIRPLEDALRGARDEVGLDFAGPADHMVDSGRYMHGDARDHARISAPFEEPGRFAVPPGAELHCRMGHAILCADSFDLFIELAERLARDVGPLMPGFHTRRYWAALAGICPPGRAMIIPTHPNHDSGSVVCDDGRPYWSASTWPIPPDRDAFRLVEIFQGIGSAESVGHDPDWRVPDHPDLGGSVRLALGRGYRLGFVAGTDNHGALPGQPKCDYFGLTAVLSAVLDTPSLFRALHARRCYATTGARIVADATLNGSPIGSELRLEPHAPRVFRVRVRGTAPVAAVQIVHLGEVLADLPVAKDAPDFDGEWADERKGRPLEDAWYYVRIRQTDGHCAWLSPWWVDLPADAS